MAATSAPSSSLRQVIDTTDVDRAREAFARMYTKATFEPANHRPFSYTLTVASLGAVHITADRWSSGAHLATTSLDDRYILAFSTEGVAGGTHAGEEFAIVAGHQGALLSPLQPSTLSIERGIYANNVTIDRAALEAHWKNLTGQTSPGPIQFTAAMDLTRVAGAAVYNVAQLLRAEVGRPDGSRVVIAGLRDALFTTLLTAQPHSESRHLVAPPPRVAPGCVRRAEEYIAAHAAEPITIEDIVAAAGVPARSLYAAFQRSRGTTPMTFLRERRLELARRQLLSATAESTVAGVVRDLGLGNPGRFSAAYKQRFGESPSETLARAIEGERRRTKAL